jgi:hypothetical protein
MLSLGPGFVMSRVCRAQGLSCPGFVGVWNKFFSKPYQIATDLFDKDKYRINILNLLILSEKQDGRWKCGVIVYTVYIPDGEGGGGHASAMV